MSICVKQYLLVCVAFHHFLKTFVPIVCSEAAEKLFDLVDNFAESAKRKAAVWPLQIILLILCPEITHTISKDTVEDSKANKVGDGEDKHTRAKTHTWTHLNSHCFLSFGSARNCFWTVYGKLWLARVAASS